MRLTVLSGFCGVLIACAVPLTPATAQEPTLCKPKKLIRYLDVKIAVEPATGAAGQQVALSAECLPADLPVIIWSGQSFNGVLPVGEGATDSYGRLMASATVPADAEPDESYYFAVMMDNHVIGTGEFLVDGGSDSSAQ